MQIKMRLMCYDMLSRTGETVLELVDGATAEQALEAYDAQYPVTIPMGEFKKSVLLVGKKAVQPHHALHDGDELLVVRNMIGG